MIDYCHNVLKNKGFVKSSDFFKFLSAAHIFYAYDRYDGPKDKLKNKVEEYQSTYDVGCVFSFFDPKYPKYVEVIWISLSKKELIKIVNLKSFV